MANAEYNSENTDLLWGARAIARAIGRTERQTFYLLESGKLPARKVGATWVAARPKLVEFLTGTATA